MTSNSDTFVRETESFRAWFDQRPGTFFHKSLQLADLRDRGAGRGIVATADIPADTDLFNIPRPEVITVEHSALRVSCPDIFLNLDDVTADEDTAAGSNLPIAWLNLIIVLLWETSCVAESTWGHYLRILPRKIESLDRLMFWTKEELSELQASAIPSKIGKRSADEMFKKYVIPSIRKHEHLFLAEKERRLNDEEILEQCHIMGSLIMSYAFELQPDEEKDDDENGDADKKNEDDSDFLPGWVEDKSNLGTMGMVPMADMLNADAEFNAHLTHGENDLTMISLREIKAGEEVLNYYGPLPNGELLRRYGYTSPKHSRYDVVEISWDIVKKILIDHKFDNKETKSDKDQVSQLITQMEEDEDSDVQEGFLLERESDDPSEEGTINTEAKFVKFPDELVEVITIVISNVLKSDAKKRKLTDSAKQLLLKKEALLIMEEIASVRLHQYATTAEVDKSLLEADKIGTRPRMAINVRLGEKLLLAEALAWTKEKRAKLSETESKNRSKKQKQKR